MDSAKRSLVAHSNSAKTHALHPTTANLDGLMLAHFAYSASVCDDSMFRADLIGRG